MADIESSPKEAEGMSYTTTIIAGLLGLVALLVFMLLRSMKRYWKQEDELRRMRRACTKHQKELAKQEANHDRALSELSDEVERLQELVQRDPLTGVLNAKGLIQAVEKEISRSHRFDHEITAIFIDIDDFTAVNKRLGHLKADGILKELVKVIVGQIREEDTLGRCGGDEFLVVMPETDNQAGLLSAQRIRTAVRRAFAEDVVTVSAGVATCQGGKSLTCEKLIEQADAAMYRAKDSGKNTVSK